MGTGETERFVEAFEEIADSLVIDLEYLGRESLMALLVVMRRPIDWFTEFARSRSH